MIPDDKIESFQLPGLTTKSGVIDYSNYSVKYFKADLDDQGDLLTLQQIETRGVRGDGVLILSRDKFTFNTSYFLIIQYMEQNG